VGALAGWEAAGQAHDGEAEAEDDTRKISAKPAADNAILPPLSESR
jgi:hypothetical protein